MDNEMKLRLRELYLMVDKNQNLRFCIINKNRTRVKILNSGEIYPLRKNKIERKFYGNGNRNWDVGLGYYAKRNETSIFVMPIVLNAQEQSELDIETPIRNSKNAGGRFYPDYFEGDKICYCLQLRYWLDENNVEAMKDFIKKVYGYKRTGEGMQEQNENRYKLLDLDTILKIEKTLNSIKDGALTREEVENLNIDLVEDTSEFEF